jgi:hypothetical protein
MSLSFTTDTGAVEIRWIIYALIRDNVQHHLEAGAPASRFETLHQISAALGGPSVSLPAARLADEMATVERDLLARPIADLAITARTRAVSHLQWPEVTGPDSEVVGPLEILGALTHGAKTLDDVFGETVRDLRELAAGAGTDRAVLVTDT